MKNIQKIPGAILFFQDEVHFQATTSIIRQRLTKGSSPQVKSYVARDKAAFSGFVIPSTGELYTHEVGWFNFESTIDSIRQFLKDRPLAPGGKYYLVMDNAPWHKKAKRLIKGDSDGLYSDIKSRSCLFICHPSHQI